MRARASTVCPALLAALLAASVATATDGSALRVYTRSFLVPPLPAAAPAAGEAEPKELMLSAAPGELEPVLLCVWSPVAVSELVLRSSALERKEGGSIPADRVRIQRVLPGRARVEGPGGPQEATVPEWVVPAERPLDSAAGRTTSFLVTARVPAGALPGTYAGRLVLSARGLAPRNVPFRVDVREFALAPPRTAFAMLYTYEFRYLERYDPASLPSKRRDPAERAGFLERGRAVVRDLAEHGMTAIFSHSSRELLRKDGRLALPDLEMSLRTARESGMTGPPGFFVGNLVNAQFADVPQFTASRDVPLAHEIAERAADVARAEGFPNVLLVLSDEPNDADGRKLSVAKQLYEAARGVPGVRLAVTSGFGSYHAPRALADRHEVSIFSAAAPAEVRASLQASGHEIWLYENRSTEGHDPTWSRFYFGFGGWRAQVAGITAWTWPTYTFAPYYERPRADADGSAVPETDESGRPINTLVWEAIREGVDDRRYLDTLAAAIARARAAGERAAADDADKTLAGIRAALPADLSTCLRSLGPYGDPVSPYGAEWLESKRGEVARATQALLARMGSGGEGRPKAPAP